MRFKILNGRKYFYQWDLNQRLIIEDYDPKCQIHFKSYGERCALLVEPYKYNGMTVVDVPNKILQTPDNVVIWVYRFEGEKYTVEKFIFDIRKRQKPNDYVYTETEIFSWKSFEKRVEAVENELDELLHGSW